MYNLLEITNLKVDFYLPGEKFSAVDRLNLYIAMDEVVVLAGESGSGKTVTALSITRILPPQAKIIEGSIRFQGKDLLKISESDLYDIRGSKIAYIFQEPTSFLNPVFSIGEQISEAIILHQSKSRQEARDETVRLLSLVNIKHPQQRIFDYPHNLSGGMNQRAMIAMALACKPRLLVADEPTTCLDVTTESQILNLLMDLKSQFKFSILFITHNLSIAKRIADRIAIMYKGRIVEEGDKHTIFGSPKHQHTKKLVAAYEKIGRI